MEVELAGVVVLGFLLGVAGIATVLLSLFESDDKESKFGI